MLFINGTYLGAPKSITLRPAEAVVIGRLPPDTVWYGGLYDAGRNLLLCFGDKWTIFSLKRRKVLATFNRSDVPVSSVRILNGGHAWIWASDDGRVLETNRGTLESKVLFQVSNPPQPFDYDPKTRTGYVGDGKSIYQRRFGKKVCRRLLSTGDLWQFFCATIDKPGNLLAVSQYRVTLLELGRRRRRFGLSGPGDNGTVEKLSFSPNGRLLAAGTNFGYLEVWSTKSPHLVMATKIGKSIAGLRWFGNALEVATFANTRLGQTEPNLICVYQPRNPTAVFKASVPDIDPRYIDWTSATSLIALSENGQIYRIELKFPAGLTLKED